MPFTLVGALLRDFIFGQVFCKLIPFLQGKSIQRARTFPQFTAKIYRPLSNRAKAKF
jgi:hypothetical protein